MEDSKPRYIIKRGIIFVGAAALLFSSGAGSKVMSLLEPEVSSAEECDDPAPGTRIVKQRLAKAPEKARVAQVYFNTLEKREYIYDGVQWVPHDNTVEEHYQKLDEKAAKAAAKAAKAAAKEASKEAASLKAAKDCSAGTSGSGGLISPLKAAYYPPTDPLCTTGAPAHPKHATYVCKTCHNAGGVTCFDPAGPAVAPGYPVPFFDDTAKNCSNISCHGMYSGSYSYWLWIGEDTWEYVTVNYQGSGGTTPSWYATGAGCSACHGNPPPNTGNWHTIYHGGGSNCQVCHNDPTKPTPLTPIATGVNGVGTQINTPAQHGNGIVTVYARWASSCFGCH